MAEVHYFKDLPASFNTGTGYPACFEPLTSGGAGRPVQRQHLRPSRGRRPSGLWRGGGPERS